MGVKKQQLELCIEQLSGSRTRKEYDKAVCCHPICLTYMLMRNARLDELQARIKMGGRNINNLRYADDTTLMAESKEELKSFLSSVGKESTCNAGDPCSIPG